MSRKPKIYAFCDAGCKNETVHKSDFDASASHIEQYIEEDGNCYLEVGKEYKIFATKDTDNQFACSVIFAYNAGSAVSAHTIENENTDKYAESFVFRMLGATISGSDITLVYELAGVRYEETITASSTPTLLTENGLYVSGATKVLLYNEDAQIVAGNGDSETENGGNSSSMTVDSELSETSENPVQNKVVNEAIKAVEAKIPTKTEEWTFTLEDGSTVTKKVVVM